MEHIRVKTALIALFLIIDIFLVGALILGENAKLSIDDSLTDNAVEVLRRNGISISRQVIGSRRATARGYYLAADSDLSRTAAELLGDGCGREELAGGETRYFSGESVFSVRNLTSLSFSGEWRGAGRQPADTAAALVKKLTPGKTSFELTDERENSDGSSTCFFSQRLAGRSLTDMQLAVTVSGGAVVSFSGTWLCLTPEPYEDNKIADQLGALMKFAALHGGDSPVTVESLELCYCPLRADDFYLLTPVWSIGYGSGREYYDAFSGDLVK